MRPDKQLIEDIAIEMGVHPSFVEKDWFAVRLIELLAAFPAGVIKPVFSGGTCLSKAYGIIQRFSEDVDFRGLSEGESRAERREFREAVLQAIRDHADFEIAKVVSQDESRYFKADLLYPQQFTAASGLRPHLLLEFKLGMRAMRPVQQRRIGSFISRYGSQPGDAAVSCVDPLEIAADKFSALLWRVLNRDRSAGNDDPAMIRHLHDLAHLYEAYIQPEKEAFRAAVAALYEVDMRRGDIPATTVAETARQVLTLLREDEVYQDEYGSFVDSMSYAGEGENIPYQDALRVFEDIILL
jgi:predicted nucleotidyltransferase component of viral defense system